MVTIDISLEIIVFVVFFKSLLLLCGWDELLGCCRFCLVCEGRCWLWMCCQCLFFLQTSTMDGDWLSCGGCGELRWCRRKTEGLMRDDNDDDLGPNSRFEIEPIPNRL